MKKTLAAAALLLTLAGLTGCSTTSANAARTAGPAQPVAASVVQPLISKAATVAHKPAVKAAAAPAKAHRAPVARVIAAPAKVVVTGAMLTREGPRFAKSPFIPTDEKCTVFYIGWSTSDRTDGRSLWSVRSQLDPRFFQTYRVVETAQLKPVVKVARTVSAAAPAAKKISKAPAAKKLVVVAPVPVKFTAPDTNNSLGEPIWPLPVQMKGVSIVAGPSDHSSAGWSTVYAAAPGYVFANGQTIMVLSYLPSK